MYASDKLIDRYEELEDYFRNTIIPQIFIDAGLRLRKFTPPAMKQFTLSPAHLGQHLSDVEAHFRFPGLKENIEEVIRTQNILEKEVQTTDMRWFQMNILPYIRKVDGMANGVIITFVDITSRIADLKEQERLIAEHELLLDALAHDIRNSIGSVKAAVESMQTMSEKERHEMEMLLEVAGRGLKRMEGIINELFETRKDAYATLSTQERVSIENIVEDVRLSLFDEIKRSAAKVMLIAGVSEITFSRRKLRSVLHNLIGNAIKYCSPDRVPEIRVETRSDAGYTIITVADNGIGIPETQQELIFEKYLRLSGEIEGSGIGLFLVKQILQNAGGTIEVRSELGKGTTFTIRIKAEH
jgi:two-component system phosphate regulon sensor histidine kinase PhoR